MNKRNNLFIIKKFYSEYTKTKTNNSIELKHILFKTRVGILNNRNERNIDQIIQILENNKPSTNDIFTNT